MSVKRSPCSPQRPTQAQILLDILLSARECGSWLSLEELAKLTRFPAQSVSAQLRHLRKPEFGKHKITKRIREGAMLPVYNRAKVWEYALGET